MRTRRLVFALAGVVLGVLAFSVAPAFAATGYGLLASFGAGQNVGPTPVGLAVDDSSSASTGDVYVTDGEVVNKFTAAEAAAGAMTPALAPLTKFGYAYGVAVDPSNGDVYVADDTGTVHKFDASGAPISFSLSGATVSAPLGIAVSPSNGNVLVGDGATNTVFEFSSAGVFTGKEYVVAVAVPVGIAVDGSGDVFVAAQGAGTLKFTAPGAISEAFASSDANGVAIDGAGDVFVAGGGQVAEYDSTGKQIGQSFGSGVLAEGFGIGLSAGATPLVYVADNTANDASVFDTGETPEAPVTEAATGVTSTTATLSGEVVGTGTGKAKYHFAYNTNGSCEGGSTTTPVEVATAHQKVSSAVTELAPGTRYTFCLVVTNAYGSATGAPLSFTTPVVVENESVVNDTATSAELQAEVATGSVGGPETTYHFEYGTSEAYGLSTPESSPLGGEHSASALVQGLQASTTYHYRVVLSNSHGPTRGVVGPDESFTTQATGGPLALLDGRQWELVSPANKYGSGIEALTLEGGEIQAADDGSAFTYVANGPVTSEPTGNRAPEISQVFSRRESDGWETQDINTSNNAPAEYAAGEGGEYSLFSSDLSVGLLGPRTDTLLSSEATEGELTLYQRDDVTGSYLPLVTAANVPAGTHFGTPEDYSADLHFEGASPDLKHVVFGSSQGLTPEVRTVTGRGNLYEWSGGKLELVSVLPDGRPASEPYGEHQSEEGILGTDGGAGDVRNTVSNDGAYIVWESERGNRTERHLYLRDMATHETVQLDVPQQGAKIKAGEHPNFLFQGASSDGSRIYFSDHQPLTSGSRADSRYQDLYVAEVVRGEHIEIKLTDLTEDTVSGEPGDFRGIASGYGDDSAGKEVNVYFVANGRLTDNASLGACSGAVFDPSQSCNLYVDHFDGVKWSASLVAILSGADVKDWGPGKLPNVASRVSSNGLFLAFMSERNLTGFDNRDAVNGEPDQEVYLYDATLNHLVCASCNPTGQRPAGVYDPGIGGYPGLLVDRPAVWEGRWLAGSLPSWTRNSDTNTNYQSRYLSNDGRLFFDSPDALVAQDINGLEDVYEYEPPQGTSESPSDTCTTASDTYSADAGGCVNLISSGTSAEESAFLDASESGDDAFFLTQARLVPADYDKSFDVYDAHVCGASAAIPAPSGGLAGGPCPSVVAEPPACTTADACRAAPAPQPGIFGAPPSATFSGAGNISPVLPAGVVVKGKTLTRAQKLTRALKLCKPKPKRKRASCVTGARKRYGAKTSVVVKPGGRTK